MQKLVHKIWYRPYQPLTWLLLPFSLLFFTISQLRRSLFLFGIKKAYKSQLPVIVVGNITAGGSGKTPMVLHLITLLRLRGFNPGVISRGYGVDIASPVWVTNQHSCDEIGDEPAMIYARTQVPMVVAPSRVEAIKLLQSKADVDLVICDDGLQHYALERDIELVIIDGQRRFGNGFLLPAGPLREGQWRLNTVDFRVCNGGIPQSGEYSMQLVPESLLALKETQCQPPKAGDKVVAMAGIGNPQRFFATLQQAGYELISCHEFADHHAYSRQEIAQLAQDYPLLMTEKDAVKCRVFAQDNWWYLPVDAKLDPEFDIQLLRKLTKITTE